ncbi:MAG: response regulator [Candidatus Kaistia colombiensis]|nr:MAG: response regulator [Kaistia sp.]
MRIAVFEDDNEKFELISDTLKSKDIRENGIIRAATVAEFALLVKKDFDLCVIDLRMPTMEGVQSSGAGNEILQMLDFSGKKNVPVIAITAYADEAEKYREKFAARGCLIFDVDQKDLWSQALDIFILQAKDRNRYDFIIFAAISEERLPFGRICGLNVRSVTRNGVDHWDCDFRGWSGTIVLLSRMGLVTASATVARVLAHYSPKVVAMTGICGGIGDKGALGQLLVTDVCWEYQSGKWLGEVQKAEPYQVSIPHNTRNVMLKLLENTELLPELESGYAGTNRPSKRVNPSMGVFSSGSAVIASSKRLRAVEQQHRKVAGIDMEIYGFHRAVELSAQNPQSFSAKVVVDKADQSKGDELHEYGCYVSAKFVMRGIEQILEASTDSS